MFRLINTPAPPNSQWAPVPRLLFGPRKRHLRSLPGSLRSPEIIFVALEACPRGEQAIGEQPNVGVVVLQGIVVALALDGNTVLRPGQLVLQAEEVFIGLELGVVL